MVSSKDLAQNQSCFKKTALRQHATHAYGAQRAAHIVETNLTFLLIEYNLQLGKLLRSDFCLAPSDPYGSLHISGAHCSLQDKHTEF